MPIYVPDASAITREFFFSVVQIAELLEGKVLNGTWKKTLITDGIFEGDPDALYEVESREPLTAEVGGQQFHFGTAQIIRKSARLITSEDGTIYAIPGKDDVAYKQFLPGEGAPPAGWFPVRYRDAINDGS